MLLSVKIDSRYQRYRICFTGHHDGAVNPLMAQLTALEEIPPNDVWDTLKKTYGRSDCKEDTEKPAHNARLAHGDFPPHLVHVAQAPARTKY